MNVLRAKFDITLNILRLLKPIFTPDLDITLYSVGTEYDFNNVTFTAEAYKSDDTLNWYSSIKYSMSTFTPYITYGKSMGDTSNHDHSITTGLRYDLTSHISLNLEYQHVNMDKDVTLPSLTSRGGPLGQFEENPLLYSTKIDANVSTLMISYIF